MAKAKPKKCDACGQTNGLLVKRDKATLCYSCNAFAGRSGAKADQYRAFVASGRTFKPMPHEQAFETRFITGAMESVPFVQGPVRESTLLDKPCKAKGSGKTKV